MKIKLKFSHWLERVVSSVVKQRQGEIEQEKLLPPDDLASEHHGLKKRRVSKIQSDSDESDYDECCEDEDVLIDNP
jgi:hypothetical protein